MSPEILTVAMFGTLIVAIAFGHPLAYTLAAVATLFGLIDNGWNVPGLFDMFANNTWGLMNNEEKLVEPGTYKLIISGKGFEEEKEFEIKKFSRW